MRPFACGACHRPVFFENTQCLACDATLAWSPQARAMVSVPADDPRLCPHRHDAAGCN